MSEILDLNQIQYSEWLPLWKAYLEFYNTICQDSQAELTWNRLIDPTQTDMFGFAIRVDQKIVGFVHLISHASTWTPLPYCYLQDLFVSHNHRNLGLAKKLIEFSYDNCKNNFDRVYWLTHERNEIARSLYNKVAVQTGFIQYKKTLN